MAGRLRFALETLLAATGLSAAFVYRGIIFYTAVMPRISEFYGIAVYIYYRDHNPPHFHAIYGELEAIIEIRTGRILEGRLPRSAAK